VRTPAGAGEVGGAQWVCSWIHWEVSVRPPVGAGKWVGPSGCGWKHREVIDRRGTYVGLVGTVTFYSRVRYSVQYNTYMDRV